MKINYDDIVANTIEEARAVSVTLRNIALRMKEPLVIECQEKREGWLPLHQIMESADRIMMIKTSGEKVCIKNRWGLNGN